ncbi:MAG: Bug family tripartite tricarboxylate transporter substrate binding protein [Burkholderiales bacterium]
MYSVHACRLSLAIAATLTAGAAFATPDAYPSRPIRFIVPFAPGGVSDIIGRTIAYKTADGLGQPMVIDNRGGAGGTIGAEMFAKAQPDGYTLGTGNISTHAVAPHMYKKMPYDPVKDFTPIVFAAVSPNVIGAFPALPVKTIRELIVYAKANPGKLSYASSGIGTVLHLGGELINVMGGIDMVHIPYKGVALALPDVMSGKVQLIVDAMISASGHVKAGRIKALAVTSAKRSPALPDVPTVAESGLPGYELDFWIGVYGPANMPPAMVKTLNVEINKALKAPDVREKLAAQGAEVVGGAPAALDKVLKTDLPRMGKIVKAAKIEPE